MPKVFLAHGGSVGFEPDLHETVYPLVTELLYAVALALRGPVACRLISWVLGLVFAANVTALARPSLGARAWWAGTVALLVPAVSNGMSAPLNDVALAAFGTAAIAGWARFHDAPSSRRAALAGLLAGLALGVKYPALVLAGLLGLAMVASALRKVDYRRALLMTIVFAAVMLAVGCPWYLRAFWYTGNPVFPFFRHVFGGAGLDEVLDPIKRPLAVSVINMLTALGPLSLQPDRFDQLRTTSSDRCSCSFLPRNLTQARPPCRVLAIVALGYAFMTLCLTQRQSMRFVLIAVGPLAVGVAWLRPKMVGTARELPGRILVATMLIVLGLESRPWPWRARGTACRSYSDARTPAAISSAVSRPGASAAGWPRISPRGRGSSARTIAAITSRVPIRWSWPTGGGRGWAAAVNRPGTWSTTSSSVDSRTSCSARRFPKPRSSSTRPSDGSSPLAGTTLTAVSRRDRRRRRRDPALCDLPARRRNSRSEGATMTHLVQPHPTLAALRATVQKERYREIGNWLARRIARPTAIYGTWLAIRLGLSAHQVTLAGAGGERRGDAGVHDRCDPGVRRRSGASASGVLARSRRWPGRPLARDGMPRRRLFRLPDAPCGEPWHGIRPRLRPGRPDRRPTLVGGRVRDGARLDHARPAQRLSLQGVLPRS